MTTTATAVADGNELIVDFVDRKTWRRRQLLSSSSDDDASYQDEKKEEIQTKHVRFSPDITVCCFPYPDRQEASRRWHSKEDKTLFTIAMEHDVLRLRYLLSSKPMTEIENETLYDCIGLEALLSGKVLKFVKKKKREHSRSVVMMQYCMNQEQLADYSMSRSLQSLERARQLADGYSVVLK